MKKADIYRIIETAAELEPGSVTGDEDLFGLGTWDSLTGVEFSLQVEEQFGVIIKGVDLEQVETVPQIIALCGDAIED